LAGALGGAGDVLEAVRDPLGGLPGLLFGALGALDESGVVEGEAGYELADV